MSESVETIDKKLHRFNVRQKTTASFYTGLTTREIFNQVIHKLEFALTHIEGFKTVRMEGIVTW